MSKETKTLGKVWVFYDTVKNKKTKPLNLIQAQATLLTFNPKSYKKILIWTPGWPKWIPLDRFLESRQTYFMMTPETSRVTTQVEDKTIRVEHFNEDHTYSVSEDSGVHTRTEIQYTKIMNDEAPEAAPDNSGSEYYRPDFRADQININVKPNLSFAAAPRKAENDERRKDPRMNYKIEVTLVSQKGKTFKSFSDNISMSGILLQEAIPSDFLKSSFNLILVNRFESNAKKARIYVDGRVIGDLRDPRRLTFLNLDPTTKQKLEEMLQSYQNVHPKAAEPVKKSS